jgi:CheY-like chemotaxis protein
MSRTPRILVVEDQYFVGTSCQLLLRSAGWESTGLATTAATAFELAERDRPDLVLMDIRLASQTDGVDAAIDIYERLGIRCIFVTADSDASTRERAQRAQPLGWLDKPYSAEALIRTVQKALQSETATESDQLNVERSARF